MRQIIARGMGSQRKKRLLGKDSFRLEYGSFRKLETIGKVNSGNFRLNNFVDASVVICMLIGFGCTDFAMSNNVMEFSHFEDTSDGGSRQRYVYNSNLSEITIEFEGLSLESFAAIYRMIYN